MKKQINEIKRMQLIAGLITESEYQESMTKIDESKDINQTLTSGGFDPIDDEKLLMKASKILSLIGGNPSAEAVNALVMVIEDAEGGNISWNESMNEAEDTLSSFKSLDQMNDYLEKGGWDPYEVADEKAEKKGLMLINKYIKSNILDKGKTLSPNKLNALLIKIEDLLP